MKNYLKIKKTTLQKLCDKNLENIRGGWILSDSHDWILFRKKEADYLIKIGFTIPWYNLHMASTLERQTDTDCVKYNSVELALLLKNAGFKEDITVC